MEKTGEMRESPSLYNRVRRSIYIYYIFNLTVFHQFNYVTDCFPTCLGSFDISNLPESKGQAPKTGEMPTYVNTQQIDAQVLAALQAEAENVTKGMAAAAKESPQKDLFDMSKSWLECTEVYVGHVV